MNPSRSSLAAAVVLAGISAAGMACAQTMNAPPAKRAPAIASEPSTTQQVETWTQKQWDTAQKAWSKDKAKWAGCQKQSQAKDLSGRQSWSFLYGCMSG